MVLETDGAFDELRGVDTSLPWVTVDTVGTRHDNVGITGMAFRQGSTTGAGYQLFLSVLNTGGTAAMVPLSIRAGGKDVVTRTLTVGAGQRSTMTVPWPGPTSGRVTASLLTHDALPLDDTAYASFAPARNLQVLVVGSQPRFIQQAFASLPGVTVRIQDAPSDDGPQADVVVYAGVQPPLLSKGNFILFDSVPPNLPLRVNGVLRVPAITGWNRSDPLLDSVSLAGIAIGQALDLNPGPGFTVLAASGRSPLLLSWDHSGVRALMLAFDPRSSDFPLRPAFPILLANALSWFFPDWLEPQADEVQAGDPRLISTGGAGVVTVLKPDGRRVDLAANGPSVTFSDTDETGFYKVDARRGVKRVRRQPLERFGNGYLTTVHSTLFANGSRGAGARPGPGLAGGCRCGAGASPPRMARVAAKAREVTHDMSFQSPLWLIALAALPPLVFLTLRVSRGGLSFLILRSASILFLVLGLAGFTSALLTNRLSVVFLLDQSRSVPEAERQEALHLIESIRGSLRGGDSATLVRFGAEARTDALEPGVEAAAEGVEVDAEATNIGAAIQAGLAQGGSGPAPRLVLLTDGNENRGNATLAAGVARAMGARIFPVPLGLAARGVEVAVSDLQAPDTVREGEAHEVTVMVRSRTAVTARVTLFRDMAPVADRLIQIAPGENAVQFTGDFPQRGLHAWDAVVEAPGDSVAQNNHSRRLVRVSGPPQVLYVSRPGKGSPSFLSALSTQGISVVAVPPTGLPGTLAGYLPFDAVILDNVPGYGIATEKMGDHCPVRSGRGRRSPHGGRRRELRQWRLLQDAH